MSVNPDRRLCTAVHFKYQKLGEQFISSYSVKVTGGMSIDDVRQRLQDGAGWLIDRTWFPNSRIVEVRFE